MQPLPVEERKMHWTRGLKHMCQLLEHHKLEKIADQARFIPLFVAGEGEVDMKMVSRDVKYSHCSLPRCQEDDIMLSTNDKFQVCTRCGVAKYCSREHQAEHWKVHKRECKKRK